MLLAICAAPIAIPLILVVVAMVLGLVVLILALVAGVAVGGVVAIGAGVFTACAGFSVLFSAGLPTMMFFCGVAAPHRGQLPAGRAVLPRHGGAAGPLAESKGGAGMNMPAKVCLGAGAFLVMSGGLLAITGFAMGAQTHLDLDWGRAHKSETPVDTGAPHVEEGTALPAFSRLDVDVSIGDVTVEYGGDYGISLTSWGGIQLEYELDGDTLKVRSGSGAWELSDWEHEVAAVITLPEGVALESADIRTALGDVTLTGVTAGTLAAGSEMGSLALYGVEADAALAVSMGDLTAEGLTTRSSCTVENAMGDVYLDGNFRGNTECTLSMGDLELYTGEPIDDYGLDMHLSMGELTLNGSEQRPVMTSPGGPHSLKVTSDMGDVRVEFGG